MIYRFNLAIKRLDGDNKFSRDLSPRAKQATKRNNHILRAARDRGRERPTRLYKQVFRHAL